MCLMRRRGIAEFDFTRGLGFGFNFYFKFKFKFKFAGPGRQPGYFLCKAPNKVSKEMAFG